MSDGLGRTRAILAHQLNDREHPAVRQEKLLLAIAESLADIADSLRNQPQEEQPVSKCPTPAPHTDSDGWSIYGRPE